MRQIGGERNEPAASREPLKVAVEIFGRPAKQHGEVSELMAMEEPKYTMKISRLTIDKLGIKLYDRVSAVLGELIANAYDADADYVKITLPLNVFLAARVDGNLQDRGFEITIEDNGIGMTAEEVNLYYLRVGLDRRRHGLGNETPGGRRVMGRKGIGKLAPFGICNEIEVITAGGEPYDGDFSVSNFKMRLDEIIGDTDADYNPEPGPLDGTLSEHRGTKVILRNFNYKRVPPALILHRQLAARFGINRPDWKVEIVGAPDGTDVGTTFVLGSGSLPIDVMEGTRIDLSTKPVTLPDGTELPVSGWVAYARESYRDEAMAGVRIFARGKLVAQTRDFDIEPGFTGEFKLRSYVVGEVHVDWLDEEEDLVRSDRQDIIWNSEPGEALKHWGQQLMKELAGQSEGMVRKKVWDEFRRISQIDDVVLRAAPRDAGFRENVIRAAHLLVRKNDRDALRDPDYVQGILDMAFAIGPQQALLEALRNIADEGDANTLRAVLELFEKARIAELYSLGQVAKERVEIVQRLNRLILDRTTSEQNFQNLIETAPWLIAPDWTPLTNNESLNRARVVFEAWCHRRTGSPITTSTINNPAKRPDFIMLGIGGRLEVVEIKKPDHLLTDEELERAVGYLDAVATFLEENVDVKTVFTSARLTIICNDLALKRSTTRSTLNNDKRIQRHTWIDVLNRTMRAHQDFLTEVRRMRGTPLRPDEAAMRRETATGSDI